MATRGYRRQAAGPRFETSPYPDGSVGWRVVAANGRPLGMSIAGYPDDDAAHAAFRSLARQPKLECEVAHGTEGVLWAWLAIDGDGTPVAVSARQYDRRGQCRHSFDHFVQTVRTFLPLKGDHIGR